MGAGSVLLIHPGGDYVRACSVVHFYVIFVCVIFHKRLFKGKKKKANYSSPEKGNKGQISFGRRNGEEGREVKNSHKLSKEK